LSGLKRNVKAESRIIEKPRLKKSFFGKLFFEKYFSESGSVYFVKTAD